MASLGTPLKDLLTKPPITQHDQFLQTLSQVLANMEGDIDLTQAFQTVTQTAGQNVTGIGVIEPPQDQQYFEWIPVCISVVDTAQIDFLDRLAFVYLDVPSGINVMFYLNRGAANSGISNNGWTWPVNVNPDADNSEIIGEFVPFRLFRKVGGDPWRRIRVDATTTATVGTRSFNCRVAYLKRPSTRV